MEGNRLNTELFTEQKQVKNIDNIAFFKNVMAFSVVDNPKTEKERKKQGNNDLENFSK